MSVFPPSQAYSSRPSLLAGPFLSAFLGCVLLLSPSSRASGTAEDGEEGFSLGGSLKTLVSGSSLDGEWASHGADEDVYAVSFTSLRLIAEGWRSRSLAAEIHLVQDVLFTSAGAALSGLSPVGFSASVPRYHLLDGEWNWAEEDDFSASLRVDRLNVRVSSGPWDLTAGRQAVNFSQAWFWNPLDVFLAFDPEAFDRTYKPGVDAVRADLSLGPFSSLSFVYSPGRSLVLERDNAGLTFGYEDFADESWYGSALLARGRTEWNNWDWTLQGGKVYGGYQAGGGFSGDVAGLGFRGEATWLFAEESAPLVAPAGEVSGETLIEDHGNVVVGVDHRFESSLYLNAEYFFNGAGDENLLVAAARVAAGETTNLSEHLLAFLVSREIHPLVTAQVSWIHSLSDGSDLFSPLFSWSVSDEAECLIGAFLASGDSPTTTPAPWGEQVSLGSEFGSWPDSYFMELAFYF